MIVLTIRTDKPEAEIGLFKDGNKIAYETWHAHRALAETLHGKIRDMLTAQNIGLHDVGGIVCFKGPGSFTGLRIGLTTANAFSYGLSLPVIGATGDAWIANGIERLRTGANEQIVMPEYGADVHITPPKR